MRTSLALLSFAAAAGLLTPPGRFTAAEPAAAAPRRLTDADAPPDSPRSVAISADGRLVALAGEPETPDGDAAVQLRDAATGRLLFRLDGHETPARSLAFSPRGDRLATVTADADDLGLTRVFDTQTGQLLVKIDAGGRFVRFSGDGGLHVAGFARVTAFDAATGREVDRAAAPPVVKAVSADARHVVGVSHRGQPTLGVRELGSSRPPVSLAGCRSEPFAVAVTSDGRTVAAADPQARTVLVWETLTRRIVHRLPAETAVLSLGFSPDGQHLFAGGSDKSIRAWEVATGSSTGRLVGHDGAVTALAAGPVETLLSGSADRTACLWPLASVRGTSLPPEPPTPPERDAAWEALAGDDAVAAYRALGRLGLQPETAFADVLGRVERQLVPVPDADLARLLTGLGHPDYRVREEATATLAKAGDSVRPHLERALAETTSPEVRARLRLLLRRSGLTPRFGPGDRLRLRRLIGQAAATPGDDSERLLRLLADAFPDPALAAEARAALSRLP